MDSYKLFKRGPRKNKKQPAKEKRYCKGCWADVTETMFCYCGEFALTKDSTYSEAEMKEMDGYPPKQCICDHGKKLRVFTDTVSPLGLDILAHEKADEFLAKKKQKQR